MSEEKEPRAGRIPGLFAGRGWMSPDFDKPLALVEDLGQQPSEDRVMTVTVEKQELVSRLDELLSLARSGTEVIVREDDTHAVKLVPVEEKPRRKIVFDMHPGAYIAPDFADPLPDEFWEGNS